MKKVIFCITFIIIALLGANSYSEEPTLPEVVYCDNSGMPGHFNDLATAISNVGENGTVYIGKPITISTPITIDKSIKLESLDKDNYSVTIADTSTTGDGTLAFIVSTSVESFVLENLSFKTSGSYTFNTMPIVVFGKSNNLTIRNSIFRYCHPLKFGLTDSEFNVILQDNVFYDSVINITPPKGNNYITLSNNQFHILYKTSSTITIKNSSIEAFGNIFDNFGIVLSDDIGLVANFHSNHFKGKSGRILISSKGQNVHFNLNTIEEKSYLDDVNYSGDTLIDFTKNWWGTRQDPGYKIYGENINYSNWAVFEDFSRFNEDPYTLTDLTEACRRLGQDNSGDNWLYNIKEDLIIDKLDLIGITRKIN